MDYFIVQSLRFSFGKIVGEIFSIDCVYTCDTVIPVLKCFGISVLDSESRACTKPEITCAKSTSIHFVCFPDFLFVLESVLIMHFLFLGFHINTILAINWMNFILFLIPLLRYLCNNINIYIKDWNRRYKSETDLHDSAWGIG